MGNNRKGINVRWEWDGSSLLFCSAQMRHVCHVMSCTLADLYRAEIAIIQSVAVSRLFRFLPNRIGDADSDQLPISYLNDE